jgi:hypothetical protein
VTTVDIHCYTMTAFFRQVHPSVHYTVRTILLMVDSHREGLTRKRSPSTCLSATCNLRSSILQTEVRLYVLYNYNKYLYNSLIRGCLFIHRQIPQTNDQPTNYSIFSVHNFGFSSEIVIMVSFWVILEYLCKILLQYHYLWCISLSVKYFFH